jgi:hypothetical protein
MFIERIFLFEVSLTTLYEAQTYITSYDLMILNNELERTVKKRPIGELRKTTKYHRIVGDPA